jgi:hypothetical protein
MSDPPGRFELFCKLQKGGIAYAKRSQRGFRVHFKWTVIEYAKVCRTMAKVCREFEVPRSTFYNWKRTFAKEGKAGLDRKKPVVLNHAGSLAQDVVDKILHLRKTYKLGPERITWNFERYHGIKTSESSVYCTLIRNGMRHVYIKPRSPQLNGKVERSHRTDQEEFYQLLTYTDDVDLNKKLAEWERFYNHDRPHGAFKGKTPYEALRCMLE